MLWLFRPSYSSGGVPPAVIDTDGAYIFDRRTLKKLKKRYVELSQAELSDKNLRAKIREVLKGDKEPEAAPIVEQVFEQPQKQKARIEQKPEIEVDWQLFDKVLEQIEVASFQREKFLLMQEMERKAAIQAYEQIVIADFEERLRKEVRRKRDNQVLEMIIPVLFDD